MKKILAVLISISIIMAISGCANNEISEEETETKTFEIYLAQTESVREYGYYDLDNLILQEKPVLTGTDIRKYYWNSHTIELTGDFIEKLYQMNKDSYIEFNIDSDGFRSYVKGGSRFLGSAQYMAFVVLVNGERVYSGTFPGSPVMPVEGEALILGDISDDRLQIKFNGEGFDIRNQDAVFNYFNDENKISEELVSESDSTIEDLRKQLEDLKNKNSELESIYNDLLSASGNTTSDEKRLQALVSWQKARLNLYTIETQEGDQHRYFCDLLNRLDPSSIASVRVAADYFRQSAGSDYYFNDRLFNVFEEFYNTVIMGIPLNYTMAEINESFISSAKAAGIEVQISNGYIEASPAPSFLRANFELFLSDILNEYLILKDRELAMILESDHVFAADDENLFISVNQVADLVYSWKNFSDSYPNNYPFNIKARLKAEKYLSIYIGKTEFEQSPIYDNETLELKSEVKESYKQFLNEHKNSSYYPLIADLFIILEGSGFILNTDVNNFIENSDFSLYGF